MSATFHVVRTRHLKAATKRTPAEVVVRAAKLFHRGVICPTEAWNLINDATSDLDVVVLLDGLESSDQELVRGIHKERPESLRHLAASREDSHFPALLHWCKRPSNPLLDEGLPEHC